MQLRDYQEKAINEVSYKLASGKRKVIFQLATGGGKTVVFSAISKRFTEKNPLPVLILVHRKELLQQTRKTLYNHFGVTSTAIVAGVKHVPYSKVYVGMVESVARRIKKLPKIGLVIIDEAHIANFTKMHDFFPEAFIIGFTATPLSSNKKKPLNGIYDDIVCGVDIPDLIKSGNLCQNITFAPRDIVERAALTVKNGEYDDSQMAAEYSAPRHVNNTVTKYEQWAKGQKTVIFNCNVAHSISVNNAFKIAGYDSRHLDGTMSTTERDNILNWFKHTPGAILNNVAVLTAGWDEPTIEVVIINKATLSMPLWLQTTGRGSRPVPEMGKESFKIIDMGGNAMTHGDWCESRDWADIFHNPKKPRENEGVAPCKNCPKCEAIIPAQSQSCMYCGYEFLKKEEAPEEEMSDLIVITKGINVASLLRKNEGRKDYFTFFEVGRKIAERAAKKFPYLTDELMEALFSEYEIHVKKWCEEVGKKYGGWHKKIAKEHLLKELSEKFKGRDAKPVPAPLRPLENLAKIQMMQMI